MKKLLLIMTLLVISCGEVPLSIKTELSSHNISEEDLSQIWTDALRVDEEGRYWPISKDPLISVYNRRKAPKKYKNNSFHYVAELKGFVNLGKVPNECYEDLLWDTFNNPNIWRNIKYENGDPYFKKIKILEEYEDKKLLYISLYIYRILFNIEGELSIRKEGENTLIHFENTKDIRLFLLGTIVKKGNISVDFKVSPYKKGWLMFGTKFLTVEKFHNLIDTDYIKTMLKTFYKGIMEYVILPL